PRGGKVTIEVRLDRGRTRDLRVQDADGRPLAGAWVSGLSDGWPMALRLPKTAGKGHGLGEENRSLVLLHPGKQFGAVVTLKARETTPVVVKLAPLGSITGTLRDADGDPLAGAQVWVSPSGRAGRSLYREGGAGMRPATTTAEGKFTLTG